VVKNAKTVVIWILKLLIVNNDLNISYSNKKMKKETLSWSDVIKIPNPDTTLTIFLHVLVHFWRAENSVEYYKTNVFPQTISDVHLQMDHSLYGKPRFHLYEIRPSEWIGIWDETPYHIEFQPSTEKSHYLDHGEYRHDFQVFVRSFLKQIKKYTSHYPCLDLLYKILTSFSIVKWKCPVCCFYHDWSQQLIGGMLLQKQVTIAPSTLLHLLTWENNYTPTEILTFSQVQPFFPLVESALERFFTEFEKLSQQTSADPILMISLLITILEKYTVHYTMDQVHEFEQSCARDMKNVLYQEYKFLQTKTVSFHHFPRDLLLIRDVFPMITQSFVSKVDASSSLGLLFLLYNMLLPDKTCFQEQTPLVVFHSCSNSQETIRPMTTHEKNLLPEYHPLLRQDLFLS
jgi:hypothetical protein